MKKLQLAKDLSLPVDVVTQTIAVLAKRRAGKSYTMRRLVEQLYKAGQQVVLVDPKGDQWGLRSSADGKSPGLPFVILGGERGDVKLEVAAGEVVAKLVVEERVSVLLDLSLFRKSEVATFMTAFLENLYRLKAKEMYRTPVMLVLDEADAIAPQKPQAGEERMLGAAEDIVRRGGQRGIGCVFVTQRSAVLNKNVLTQAQILIALRTIAPQDLKAMQAWIDVHGTLEQQQTLMESLPALPVGDAWVWSPGWPTTDGIFKRVHVLPIETFDSGKSPEPGSKPVEPKSVADVDIDALTRQMAETIERSKAEDPKELRKQLAAVKAELAAKQKALADVDARAARTEAQLASVRTTKKEEARAGKIADLQQQLARHRRALEEAMKILVKVKAVDFSARGGEALEQAVTQAVTQVTAGIEKRVAALADRVAGIQATAAAAETAITQLLNEKIELDVVVKKQEPFSVKTAPSAKPARVPSPAVVDGDFRPSSSQQRILNALLWADSLGLGALDKTRLALLADASPTSSTYSNNLGALRSAGLVDYPTQGRVVLTEAGGRLAVCEGVPTTNEELQQQLFAKLSASQVKILKVLIHQYPSAVQKEPLAQDAEASATSSTFSNNLGALRSLGLIDYPTQGWVVAKSVLFLENR